MNFKFDNQRITVKEKEECEDIEQLKAQEEHSEEETAKQLSPPEVNTVFNSEGEVYEYCRQHGLQNGFGIMIRNTRKIDGVSMYLTVACHRYGERNQRAVDSLKPKPVVKTNCKARLCAKRMDEDNKWRVTQFDNEHNHNLSPTGIPMNKSFNALEHGGHENMSFSKKDCENYMRIIRRLRLAEGDVVDLQSYFNNAQSIDSNFYYSIDLDDENRIRNLFWADARCRAAYKELRDVVTFDTTYLTNKYDMPFAPFVRVNHHGQSILLGCGLVSNEDIPTFVWLFETWLACMNDNPPNAIITD
ncbi:hypothetical protein POM88_026217 [Heracleum sosnowskyi]|uniref:Protein FAR1-RELATED SEQUENCE n=1 Tax=Heracleum sosnowskyi TaxID=360622 RepID=A0AAD8MPS1_9APIA|nr:hypothetical protein POM88_026217 [Heracleum sosnowskyi]